MRFCLKFLQINGRILRRNLHFIEKTMLGRNALPAWFFIVLDLFPDTFSACMRCVNFNFVYFWSYPDLFPHTEKRHLSYLSNILQKEKSAEKSALFHLLSLLPWHQYYALNVHRNRLDNIISCWKCSLFRAKIIVECVIWMTLTHFCSSPARLQRISFLYNTPLNKTLFQIVPWLIIKIGIIIWNRIADPWCEYCHNFFCCYALKRVLY